MNWFEDLKSEVTSFLEKATKEEIQEALERANYAFYKDIDVPILGFHERMHEWIRLATFRASLRLPEPMMMINESTCFEEITAADTYGYALAA